MAIFGNGSGPVAPINLGLLASKGSLYVTRPTLFTHIATREATQAMADDLFAAVTSGAACSDMGAAAQDTVNGTPSTDAGNSGGVMVIHFWYGLAS